MKNLFSPSIADSWRSHVTTTCYWVLGNWWATFSNELKLTKRVHWAQILQKYSGLERETGRSLLESLCRSKHHLKVPDITPNLSAWHFHSIISLPHFYHSHTLICVWSWIRGRQPSSVLELRSGRFKVIQSWHIWSQNWILSPQCELSKMWKIEDWIFYWYCYAALYSRNAFLRWGWTSFSVSACIFAFCCSRNSSLVFKVHYWLKSAKSDVLQ